MRIGLNNDSRPCREEEVVTRIFFLPQEDLDQSMRYAGSRAEMPLRRKRNSEPNVCYILCKLCLAIQANCNKTATGIINLVQFQLS